MKCLIVHAHPEPRSFCAAMKDAAREELAATGAEVRISDLYAMGFNPVASAGDFGERSRPEHLIYQLEQRHNYQTGTLAPDIAAEVEKLLWCDLLVLNFPLYWFSVPAILKGWIDRVLLSGLCYTSRRLYDRGGLAGRRAMPALTVGGRREWFEEGGIHGPLEGILKPLLQGTLAYVGMTVLPPAAAFHVPYVDAAERDLIMDQYRARLRRLDEIPPLTFPSLADYDDRLMPRDRPA